MAPGPTATAMCEAARPPRPRDEAQEAEEEGRDAKVGALGPWGCEVGFANAAADNLASALSEESGSLPESPAGSSRQPGSPEGSRPTAYGGNFAWVGAHYKMRVNNRLWGPLPFFNGLTQKLLVLEDLVMMESGQFRRPNEAEPVFPKAGVDLRWRWDAERGCIIIDFFLRGQRLAWRWDELTPSEELRFPSTVPDFEGVGHAGKWSFAYTLLSAAAEACPGTSPSRGGSSSSSAPALPCPLRGALSLEGLSVDGRKAREDLARLCLADGGAAQLLFLCPGMQRPVALRADPRSAEATAPAAGELGAETVESVLGACFEKLAAALPGTCESVTLPADILERVAARAATEVRIGVASALRLQPAFLQPVHLLVGLGRPWQMRVLTYGYVAELPTQIQGDGMDARAPFVLRLVSPELTADAAAGQPVRYVAREAGPLGPMLEELQADAAELQAALESGQWSELF